MNIAEIYEKAKADGKEHYELRITSVTEKDINIEAVYDTEYDDVLEWLILV